MAETMPERAPDIRVTAMAADANPYGKAFVGWIFGQMSLAGGSLASRRTGKRAPVVAADGFKFTAPVAIGDELSVWAELVAEGRTSLTIETVAWARDRHGEGSARVAEGRFVFVGVDESPSPLAGEGRGREARKGEGKRRPIGNCSPRSLDARRNPTEAETRLWTILRDRRPSSHVQISRRSAGLSHLSIADFICLAERLIVEADGSPACGRQESMRGADGFLSSQGFRVLRFWNNHILGESEVGCRGDLCRPVTPSPSHCCAMGPSLSRNGRGVQEHPMADTYDLIVLGSGPGRLCRGDPGERSSA